MKIVCTSGYFNPLHKGHLALLREARKLGDKLVVIVNNDEQVKLKGSKPFMDARERAEIVDALKDVDEVYISVDNDRTVRRTLGMLNADVFAKGGDSTPENTPERALCEERGIEIVYNVGGEKVQSSSTLLCG